MGESGGDDREQRDEISLLTEELIQLSVKRSRVVPNEKPTLICIIWTEKLYNPKSFRAQMKSLWKTKKKFEIHTAGQNLYLIVFELEEDLEIGHRLSDYSSLNSAEKSKIREDPPYTLALKAESKLVGKESIKFNDFSKKVRAQCSYIGDSENGMIEDKIIGEVNNLMGVMHGRPQVSDEEKMLKN
ncbi:hypothetical protein Gohar_027017 [Gossypium harknessii]|uniref:DUF4283 domain-containing protein n=1 Tax=Gossypium harknessii TaxID=34285 RepID=A0A7J9HTE5_9ROSI|nr:hypothetical protein [Gossypium harknessii]